MKNSVALLTREEEKCFSHVTITYINAICFKEPQLKL